MKKIIFFSILLLVSSKMFSLKSQVIKENDIDKYKYAFHHILNDTTFTHLYVSEIVVDLDRLWFKDEKINYPCCKEAVESFRYSWFDDFSSNILKKEFVNNNDSLGHLLKGNILFFSTIYKNTLRVDIFTDVEKGFLRNTDYKSASTFGNIIYAYLFCFDVSGKIKSVYKRKVYCD